MSQFVLNFLEHLNLHPQRLGQRRMGEPRNLFIPQWWTKCHKEEPSLLARDAHLIFKNSSFYTHSGHRRISDKIFWIFPSFQLFPKHPNLARYMKIIMIFWYQYGSLPQIVPMAKLHSLLGSSRSRCGLQGAGSSDPTLSQPPTAVGRDAE